MIIGTPTHHTGALTLRSLVPGSCKCENLLFEALLRALGLELEEGSGGGKGGVKHVDSLGGTAPSKGKTFNTCGNEEMGAAIGSAVCCHGCVNGLSKMPTLR